MKNIFILLISVVLLSGNLINKNQGKINEFDRQATELYVNKEQKLIIGDTITSKLAEIKINAIEFSYSRTADKIRLISNENAISKEETLIYIDVELKNITGVNLLCNKAMKVEANYDKIYDYFNDKVVQDLSGGFIDADKINILPSETKEIRFFIRCPKVVKENDTPLVIKFFIDDKEYYYVMRGTYVRLL